MAEQEKYTTDNKKKINKIIDNYIQTEKALVNQLYFNVTHPTTIGGFREDIWKNMFEQIIPRKFVIEQSVFIIDSHGNISNEVDLAIFDEMYTPYIFRYGRIKFIPIEAVVVVVECKSSKPNPEELQKWAESINTLQTSNESYTRIASGIVRGADEQQDKTGTKSQTATRPIRILCCLSNQTLSEPLEDGTALFDITIRAIKEDEKLKIEMCTEQSLKTWYQTLNHAKGLDANTQTGNELSEIKISEYAVKPDDTTQSLLSLNLQLNQLLMLINNPMWFPHKAYVDMFNTLGKSGGNQQ
jgi:hypothetical protein